MKARLINGQLEYKSQFKEFVDKDGNTTVTKVATEQQWIDWGFKEAVNPIYDTDSQVLGKWYETEIEITRYVIDKTVAQIKIFNQYE